MSTLHPLKTVQAVQPRYVSQFSCTGPACEDNCCTGWTVSIDKKTFTTYQKAEQPLLKDRFKNQVSRTRKLNSDSQYARIQMQPETHACPFMEEKLCGIQREMGEDKLSDTCATYPRVNRMIGAEFEQALNLSCPEAARLALLQADAMDLLAAPVTLRPGTLTTKIAQHGLTPALMDQVRAFALQLMRTEGLVLWQKLAVLGVFCEQLTLTLRSGGQARIPALLEELAEMVTSGAIEQALSAMQPDHASQAAVFSSLWQLKIKRKLSPVQSQVHQAVARGLGADPQTHEVTQQQLIDHYTRGVARLPEALAAAPFLLENYVINEMFSEAFPFGEATPQAHYAKLVTRFGLVRLMLAAQCNDPEQLPDAAQMARTVQVFCRQYQHDISLANLINTALENSGWDSLEKIYRFLRS